MRQRPTHIDKECSTVEVSEQQISHGVQGAAAIQLLYRKN
jgi:hypothetical protein